MWLSINCNLDLSWLSIPSCLICLNWKLKCKKKIEKKNAQSFLNSFEGGTWKFEKICGGERGSSIFVFYCIFKTKFFNVVWGGYMRCHPPPPLPSACVHLWIERKEINFTSTCRAVSSAAVLKWNAKMRRFKIVKKIEIVFDSI